MHKVKKITEKLALIKSFLIVEKPDNQPYVFTVKNTTAEMVKDVSIFGSYTFMNAGIGKWEEGSFFYNGIKISSDIRNLDYCTFLNLIMVMPLKIKNIWLNIISGSRAQLVVSSWVEYVEPNGNSRTYNLIPSYSDHEDVTVLSNDNVDVINGGTRLILNVLPNAEFKVKIWPAVPYIKIRPLGALWHSILLIGLIIRYSFSIKKAN